MAESWSLEKIIKEVNEEYHLQTKTLNSIFVDIIECMGVASTSLQNDNKRYKFSRQGYDFWVEALVNYTSPPYSYIRARKYDELPFKVINEFMNMVVETMGNAKNQVMRFISFY